MTKINLFKEYTTNMYEIKESICENVRFCDEPFTYGNDTLRKLWYYSNNVDKYLLQKNDVNIYYKVLIIYMDLKQMKQIIKIQVCI